jgi:hypothetical protein
MLYSKQKRHDTSSSRRVWTEIRRGRKARRRGSKAKKRCCTASRRGRSNRRVWIVAGESKQQLNSEQVRQDSQQKIMNRKHKGRQDREQETA